MASMAESLAAQALRNVLTRMNQASEVAARQANSVSFKT